jgi:hypothetical protein
MGCFMNTKLTHRLDDALIAQAKKFARAKGKSLSQIVADYFKAIQHHSGMKTQQIGPITSKLTGCLKDVEMGEDDYKTYLERKFF